MCLEVSQMNSTTVYCILLEFLLIRNQPESH